MISDQDRVAWLRIVLTDAGGTVPHGTGNRAMKCPFHDDRHASGTIHLDRGLFACMACGVQGDAISIYQDETGVSFTDALKHFEGIAGPASGQPRADETASNLFVRPRNHKTDSSSKPVRRRTRFGG